MIKYPGRVGQVSHAHLNRFAVVAKGKKSATFGAGCWADSECLAQGEVNSIACSVSGEPHYDKIVISDAYKVLGRNL